jgi:hypothetical protein
MPPATLGIPVVIELSGALGLRSARRPIHASWRHDRGHGRNQSEIRLAMAHQRVCIHLRAILLATAVSPIARCLECSAKSAGDSSHA